MKKWAWIITTVMMAGFWVGQAFAMGPWGGLGAGYGPGPGPMMGYPCPRMGGGPAMGWFGPMDRGPEKALTPEQRTQIRELRWKHFQETQGLRAEMFKKRQELWELESAANPDMKAIHKKQDEIYSLRRELQERAYEFYKEARNIVPNLYLFRDRGFSGGPMGPYGGRGFGYCW